MAGFDLTEGIRKAFLAGVGAVAYGAEKSQELVDELISKGELTVEQGKALNAELTRKVKETADEGSDAVLRAHLKMMTPEEREAWVARAQKIAADIDAEPVEVDVEEAPDADASDEEA
jgi:polyhydroxyalkanoate synthesis regulator phasin